MTIPLIFKSLDISENKNKRILIIGDSYDKITCLSLNVLSKLDDKIKYDNVIIINGNTTCNSFLDKKYDDIKYFDDVNLLMLNHIITSNSLINTNKKTIIILFTDSKIQFVAKLKELMYNFNIYNTTLIVATTNADTFASESDIRKQFDIIMLMNHWDKELLYSKYASIFPSYTDFTKTHACMTLNNGSLVIRQDMSSAGYGIYSSVVFSYKLDVNKYNITELETDPIRDEGVNLIDCEDMYVLKI